MFISTAFGSGAVPHAQGTFASFTCILLWGTLHYAGFWAIPALRLLAIAVLTALGVWSIAKLTSRHPTLVDEDPGFIVIDEWAGMLIALFFVDSFSVISILLAFSFFRFLDILKPGPVRWAESLPGAWGIMTDDLLAGALAAILYYYTRGFLPA